MSENIIETNKNGTAGTEKPEKKHSGLSRILNKYFHHIDRGGSMKSEITAGCLMCILSVCGMFMNMQLITTMTVSGPYAGATVEQIAANGEIIAGTYFISMLIAFLGSLAIGLIARLPLVQVSGLGLSTVMISLVGTKSGLTYYNLLAVCFVSAILYAVAVSLPFVRKFLFKAIPASVRKAVPAAVGVMIAFVGLQLSGIVTVNGSSLPAYGAGTELGAASDSVGLSGFLGISLFNYSTDRFHPTLLLCCISALLAIVLIFIFKARKAKHPYLWSLLISTAFLIVTCVLTVAINWKMMKISFDSLLGRAWMIGSEDAMQTHLSAVFSNFSFGKVFREGFDFSAYTAAGGSVFLLFVTGVLTMLFAFSCHNEATLTAVYNDAGLGEADRKARRLALMCNAGMNIAAPLFGGSPVSIGQESCAGAGDNAKSGLASVATSVGFFLSMFVWIIPAVFVTATSSQIQMNLYGHHGKVLQLLTECSFGIADAVMVIVGLSMVKHSMDIDWKNSSSSVSLVATIAGTFFLSNVAYGVALGCVAYTLLEVLKAPAEGRTKKECLRAVGIPAYLAALVSLLMLIFAALL